MPLLENYGFSFLDTVEVPHFADKAVDIPRFPALKFKVIWEFGSYFQHDVLAVCVRIGCAAEVYLSDAVFSPGFCGPFIPIVSFGLGLSQTFHPSFHHDGAQVVPAAVYFCTYGMSVRSQTLIPELDCIAVLKTFRVDFRANFPHAISNDNIVHFDQLVPKAVSEVIPWQRLDFQLRFPFHGLAKVSSINRSLG